MRNVVCKGLVLPSSLLSAILGKYVCDLPSLFIILSVCHGTYKTSCIHHTELQRAAAAGWVLPGG